MTSALFALSYVKSLMGRVFTEERAQDAFEYILVIGGVTVLVIGAIATPIGTALIDTVVGGVCTAVDGVLGTSTLGC
jgi:hypothetical protein